MNYSYKDIGKSIGLKTIEMVWLVVFIGLTILFALVVCIFWVFKNKYLNKTDSKRTFVEGFQEGSGTEGWSDDLIKRFNLYQSTTNDNRNRYNLAVIQEQASPAEAETLLETGYWPWSKDTQYEYTDSMWHHPIIKVNVGHALDYAMKTYNETAAKRVLSWNTKEGQFLLYGGKGSNYNTIKCSTDENNNASMIGVIKKEFKDDYIENSVPIADADIPNQMPGFSFTNGGSCNPCVALHNDYSCPFKLNVKGDDKMSSIWSRLWSS